MGSLNILDISIVAILFLFSVIGFARGFLASLLKLFSSVVSLAIGVWLAKPVAIFIDGVFNLTNLLSEKIGAQIATIDPFFSGTVGVDVGTVPDASILGAELKSAIMTSVDGLSFVFQKALGFLIHDDVVIESGTVLSEWFGTLLGGIAMLIISALLVYIAIRIAVGILSRIFDAITKNAAIGGLDRLLGFAFGAAKGALVIGVIFGVYSIIGLVPAVEAVVGNLLDSSVIGKEVYEIVSQFVAEQIGNIDFNSIIQGALSSITG